jgi:hypothetical protein
MRIASPLPSPLAGEGAPKGRMGGARRRLARSLRERTPSPVPPRKGEGEYRRASFLQLDIHAVVTGMIPFSIRGLTDPAPPERTFRGSRAKLSATLNFLNLFPAVAR